MRSSEAPTSVSAALRSAYEEHANKPAVKHGDSVLSYAELGVRARHIASALQETVDCTGSTVPLVAVVIEGSIEYVAALMGVLEAGCAYLPLDPQAPDAYLRKVIEDSGVAAVVAAEPVAARLRGLDVAVLTVQACLTFPIKDRLSPLRRDLDPAYAIYTSGSSGEPKGVLVSHKALLNSTLARTEVYGSPRRQALILSVSFDVTTGGVFWTLLSGGLLVISMARPNDLAGTIEFLRSESVSHIIYPPSLYATLLDRLSTTALPSLSAVILGGERWSDLLIERHASVLPEVGLYNEYGPTETCVWSSYAQVYDAATRRSTPLTIGRPIRNTSYVLLDGAGRPASPGEVGELYIAGDNVALGYLRRPQLTAERFVTLASGERAYRSGDLARVTAEGDYVFVGRADRQLKLHGHRIEAGEIESTLMRHAAVSVAHVMLRNDHGAGSTLVGYVVMRDAGGTQPQLAAEALREYLAALLPQYMVPTAIVALPALPMGRSGKLDESALPAPRLFADEQHAQFEPGVESAVGQGIARILGGARLGPDSPLALYGVNSLAYVRISAFLRAEFGVDVPMSALFAGGTVRSIAKLVAGAAAVCEELPMNLEPHRPDAPMTLSPQQQQIWFLRQLSPDARAYNAQFSLQIDGPLNLEFLQRALADIVVRHEILRTTFHEAADGPVQCVQAPWQPELRLVDLSDCTARDRQTRMRQDMLASMAVAFDVSMLPLVRWNVYKLSEQRWVILQVEHHFVHDGWSGAVFLTELRDRYRDHAEPRQTPDERQELPVLSQYGDYVRWYQAWAESEGFRKQAQYWTAKLAGCPESVSFEPDFPRVAAQSFDGGCIRATVPAATIERLDTLCRSVGTSRFAFFLSAFTLLAARHAGVDDLVVGSAFSNRRHARSGSTLGMFVNALPLRVSAAGNPTVKALVGRLMQTILEAQDHQEFPLVEIVRRSGVARDPRKNPLFQLMFAFHDSPMPEFEAGGIRGVFRIEHNGSAKNDVNVVCVPQAPLANSGLSHNGVSVLWEFNKDVYKLSTARRMLDNFLHVVDAMLDAWDVGIDDVSVLCAAEHTAVLRAGHGPVIPAQWPLLHQGVDAAIRENPDAIAIVQGNERVTYAELDSLARRVERRLRAEGRIAGQVVALALQPSPLLVACWLAVLRSGAAYVCLDHEQPAARLNRIIDDARPSVIVCEAATASAVSAASASGRTLVFPQDFQAEAEHSLHAEEVLPDSTAYLVYTSGSTGEPKAVIATHRNAATALAARTAYFGEVAPRTLVTLPPYFDVAGSMVFWTLSLHGTVALPQDAQARDPEAIRGLIDRHEISHVNFVASFYAQFLHTLPKGWQTSLRIVAIGGEPCTEDTVRRHARHNPAASLHNEYGPTEATVWCSATCAYAPGERVSGKVSIGRPLANYSLFVLDAKQRPLPIGARGELCVSGPGVSAGYLARPELTASRFVDVQAGPLAGSRIYRTGDEGRLLPSGELEIVGRLDDQVKIRGYRIELGEVRRGLIEHPQVVDAFVCVDRSEGVSSLVAYVSGERGCTLDVAVLRAWLAQRLPAYMLPSAWVTLPALPLTATGKVDRARLPAPQREPAAPRARAGATERSHEQMLSLWRDVLGTDDLGADDDFFECGGDSLQAIRLAAKSRTHALRFSVTDLLEARTVRALCMRQSVHTEPAPRLKHREPGTRLPLTSIQGWFFAQGFAAAGHFNQARLVELDAAATEAVLTEGLRWTFARHDAFRTTFRHDDAGWTQILGDVVTSVDIRRVDLPEASENALEEQLRRAVSAGQHGFDITKGPLWEATLFTHRSDGRRWLLLAMHHLIVDAVSWDIVLNDIEQACARSAAGQPQPEGVAAGISPLPPAPMSDEEFRYWQGLAETSAHAVLRRSTSVPSTGFGEAHIVTRRLSRHASRLLAHEVTRLTGSRTQSVLLAALHEAMDADKHAPGLYVLLEGHGRAGNEHAGEIVGWLTSLYPVLLDAQGAGHLFGAAGKFDLQLAQVPAQGVNFGAARYLDPDSKAGRLASSMTLPDITFNYLGQRTAAARDQGRLLQPSQVSVERNIDEQNALPTPIDVTASYRDDVLHVRFAVSPAVLDLQHTEALCERFVGLLERASRLVCLNAAHGSGEQAAHFLVHPVGGGVDWYVPLARSLAMDRQCFAFVQWQAGAGVGVEQLALSYVSEMRAVQRSGPYEVTGWSFGATVAFEMARLLEAAGETVRLTLIDPPPVFGGHVHDDAARALAAHLAALFPLASKESILAVCVQTAAMGYEERLQAIASQLLLADASMDAPARAFVQSRLELLLSNHQALASWRPAGRVETLSLILSSEAQAGGVQDGAAWQKCARQPITRVVVAGNHNTMLTGEGLQQIASHLRCGGKDELLPA